MINCKSSNSLGAVLRRGFIIIDQKLLMSCKQMKQKKWCMHQLCINTKMFFYAESYSIRPSCIVYWMFLVQIYNIMVLLGKIRNYSSSVTETHSHISSWFNHTCWWSLSPNSCFIFVSFWWRLPRAQFAENENLFLLMVIEIRYCKNYGL